jgi:hypothetical protein
MGGYLNTRLNGFVPLRAADITADASPVVDATASGSTLWDTTKFEWYPLQPGDNGVQVIFMGEGDDTDYFGCRVFAKPAFGPILRVVEISGHFGNVFAPNDGSATVDTTTHKLAETILMESSNRFYGRTVTVADCSSNRAATIDFDLMGLSGIYFEFYNIGDTTEVHSIRPWGRTW